MLSDTDRLLGTVEQVLKAGQAGLRSAKHQRVEVEFDELVRECMDLVRTRHHLQPDALHYEAANSNGAGAQVFGDAEELRTAVSNLLDNAVKYSGGKVDVAVRLETREKERGSAGARPRGRDSAGRVEANLQALLPGVEPVAGAGEGHGFGTVYRAVDCPQARRESVRGKRGRRAGNHGDAGIAAERCVDGASMSRVLVVEDESHLANGLSYNLEAEGHSVEVAGDGESALDRLLAKNENFDAVVLDVMLPGKNGFEVATELRAARNFVPVLMLTARGRPEDVLKGFASGADDYLPKPFELAILLARLKGLLRRSEWLHGSRSSAAGLAGSETIGPPPNLGDVFSFRGKSIDFSTLELSTSRGKVQLTADGGGTAAASDPQRRASGVAEVDSRGSLGAERRHRYAGHR